MPERIFGIASNPLLLRLWKQNSLHFFVQEEDFLSLGELETNLTALSEAEQKGDVQSLREILKKVVSGFTPEEEIVDVVYLQKNQKI